MTQAYQLQIVVYLSWVDISSYTWILCCNLFLVGKEFPELLL